MSIKKSGKDLTRKNLSLIQICLLIIGIFAFSYALAGFVFDLMYVAMGLVAAFFNTANIFGSGGNYQEIYDFITAGLGHSYLIYIGLYSVVFLIALVLSIMYFVISAFGAGVFGGIISALLIAIAVIVIIFLFFAMVWYLLKIAWMLIKSFATTILLIMFSPLQITFGVLSKDGGTFDWLRSIAANLAVFPVVSFLLILSLYFAIISIALSINTYGLGAVNDVTALLINWLTGGVISNMEVPGWVFSSPRPIVPLLGSGMLPFIFAATSFAVLAIAPKSADIIKSMLERKPYDYGTAIGQALGLVTALPTWGYQNTIGLYTEARKKAWQQRVIDQYNPRAPRTP